MYFLYTSKNIPLENHRTRPGMVANAYDPSNSGGGDQEDLGLRQTQAKKLWIPHLNQ
jgi:hypothetical protein